MKLHAYQEVAVDFLHGRDQAGLFLDMGLGKTAITLSALEPRHLPALVVAPKRVAEHVWSAERDLWRPDLTLSLAAGTQLKRQAALATNSDVTVISRDNLSDVSGLKYRTLILDELSSFKNRSSQRWKAARRLAAKADHVWGLTGTPTPNGYLDLWAQVFLLDKGQRLGTALTRYREAFFVPTGTLPSGVTIGWRPRPGAEETIRKRIEDICLYMSSADELDLPDVVHNRVTVDLPGQVQRLYEQMRLDWVIELAGDDYSAGNSGVLSNKLSQLAAGFIFSDEGDGTYIVLHDAKLEALREIVDGTGDNILVFYNYVPEAERIRAAFPQARMIDERGVLAGWARGEVPMMLAHPASAGHGLNLQSGSHTMVWTSLTWDLEPYQQACARLARQGQRHPVIIHTIESRGTVDQIMAARLGSKSVTQQELLDYLRSPI